MPICKVDGVETEFEPGMNVLQVAELAGKDIPRLHHERLSIAGNCRMCLVEVKPGPPKPQASVLLAAGEYGDLHRHAHGGRRPVTGSSGISADQPTRWTCPICDQGGECDLQDQAMGYGRDDSRYADKMRAVEEKFMGPLTKTVMTRMASSAPAASGSSPRWPPARYNSVSSSLRGEDVEIQPIHLDKAATSVLVRQHHRPAPGGRAELLEALRLQRAILGAEEDTEECRRDGRHRPWRSGGCPLHSGALRAAAHQRGHQRGGPWTRPCHAGRRPGGEEAWTACSSGRPGKPVARDLVRGAGRRGYEAQGHRARPHQVSSGLPPRPWNPQRPRWTRFRGLGGA